MTTPKTTLEIQIAPPTEAELTAGLATYNALIRARLNGTACLGMVGDHPCRVAVGANGRHSGPCVGRGQS